MIETHTDIKKDLVAGNTYQIVPIPKNTYQHLPIEPLEKSEEGIFIYPAGSGKSLIFGSIVRVIEASTVLNYWPEYVNDPIEGTIIQVLTTCENDQKFVGQYFFLLFDHFKYLSECAYVEPAQRD